MFTAFAVFYLQYIPIFYSKQETQLKRREWNQDADLRGGSRDEEECKQQRQQLGRRLQCAGHLPLAPLSPVSSPACSSTDHRGTRDGNLISGGGRALSSKKEGSDQNKLKD